MPRTCMRTVVIVVLSLTVAFGVLGCSGTGSQVPAAPMEPADRARDAADKANTAIKGLQSDVDSITPGK